MSAFRRGTPFIIGAVMLLASSAWAQINPNDGPQVAPLQREPTIGLPQQAPAAPPPAPAPQAAPAAPRPAAPPAPQADRPAQPAAPRADAGGSSWQLECVEEGDQPRMCQAILRARVNEQVAMVVAIAKAPGADEARLQMALPLGIDMQRGALVTIGDFSETLAPSRCTAQGCLVEAAASAQLLDAMRKGSAGTVRVHAPGGDAIDLPMSLTSATEVFAQAALQ